MGRALVALSVCDTDPNDRCSGIYHKITEACMTPGNPELDNFDHTT